jgi:hypothetical protein
MASIYKQIPSFGIVTADNGVAPKKLQVNRFVDNQFGARSSRNGSLETMKAFVIKKNFQSHCWRQVKKRLSTDCALSSVGELWSGLGQVLELKSSNAGANFA